jgi:hypothetical protein
LSFLHERRYLVDTTTDNFRYLSRAFATPIDNISAKSLQKFVTWSVQPRAGDVSARRRH